MLTLGGAKTDPIAEPDSGTVLVCFWPEADIRPLISELSKIVIILHGIFRRRTQLQGLNMRPFEFRPTWAHVSTRAQFGSNADPLPTASLSANIRP